MQSDDINRAELTENGLAFITRVYGRYHRVASSPSMASLRDRLHAAFDDTLACGESPLTILGDQTRVTNVNICGCSDHSFQSTHMDCILEVTTDIATSLVNHYHVIAWHQ